MNWVIFSLLTIVLYGVHDILLKYLSDNTNALMASLIINVSAAAGILGYLLLGIVRSSRTEIKITTTEIGLLTVAGVSLGLATVTFMKAFSKDGDFSVVVPIVYTGIILISVVVGYFLFKERISTAQIVGIALACFGIYLMTQKSI